MKFKILVPCLISIYSICSLFSCGVESIIGDNDKCGDIITWQGNLTTHFIKYEVSSDNITFIYEDLTEPQDICIDVPISVEFDVHSEISINHVIPDNDLSSATIQGKAYANLIYNQKTTLGDASTEQKNFGGEQSINLKNVFGNSPGWIGLQILIVIPTKDFSDNNIKILMGRISNVFTKMEITLNYHAVK